MGSGIGEYDSRVDFLAPDDLRTRSSANNDHAFKKSTTSFVVAEGFSSVIQCPLSGIMASSTFSAAKRITVAIMLPEADSPPAANTQVGRDNCVSVDERTGYWSPHISCCSKAMEHYECGPLSPDACVDGNVVCLDVLAIDTLGKRNHAINKFNEFHPKLLN
jgi:hypothetical protein